MVLYFVTVFNNYFFLQFLLDKRVTVYLTIILSCLFRYKHEIAVDGDPVIFEICDTSTKVG